MNTENPYLKKKSQSLAPLIFRVPMHDFESGEQVDADLLPEEMCVARIPNSQDLGYTHHVALVYKSLDGEVFSMTLAQHDGDVKPGTIENIKKKDVVANKKKPLGKINGVITKRKTPTRKNK